MEHAQYLVDILDQEGRIIGQKPRRAVDKTKDIYHAIYVLLITPVGELVLTIIPAREDLPNLYARQFGATVATIRRHKETARKAARRSLSREVFIDDADVKLLGEQMLHLPDGRQTYATTYYLIGEAPAIYSVIDIDTLAVVNPRQFRDILQNNPKEISPTLAAIWETYKDKLPI